MSSVHIHILDVSGNDLKCLKHICSKINDHKHVKGPYSVEKISLKFVIYNLQDVEPFKYAINIYIIFQAILAFELVLAYDLLNARCTIDAIITKFFPLCFKMAESFKNLDNILHDWAKEKYKKNIAEALNRYEKHRLAGKILEKSAVERIK